MLKEGRQLFLGTQRDPSLVGQQQASCFPGIRIRNHTTTIHASTLACNRETDAAPVAWESVARFGCKRRERSFTSKHTHA